MHYTLTCLATGTELSDDDLPLLNPDAPNPAFLRTRYRSRAFSPGPAKQGLYRFAGWLPVHHVLAGSSAPITYRSIRLARHLGLSNLFITFSGYWPERGARMLTGTFKECEAYSVCSRLPRHHPDVLVVASAGNTARAFTRVCSDNNIPLVVVIPERNLPALWSVGPVRDNVSVVAAAGDSDYADAIQLAETIASLPGFAAEGGARNVARRDGMATTVLSAVDTMNEIPQHYFQAVGSGTGAIAAWESNLRLIESDAYEPRRMRLHVSQNAPFTPIHDSWQLRSPTLLPIDETLARIQISAIGAKVLANRDPAYAIRGGLFDALTDTQGTTAAIENADADAAALLFRRLEGIDIEPAAAVAVAHLIRAVREEQLPPSDSIMLNVTGGGAERVRKELGVQPVPATHIIPRDHNTPEAVADLLRRATPNPSTTPVGA